MRPNRISGWMRAALGLVLAGSAAGCGKGSAHLTLEGPMAPAPVSTPRVARAPVQRPAIASAAPSQAPPGAPTVLQLPSPEQVEAMRAAMNAAPDPLALDAAIPAPAAAAPVDPALAALPPSEAGFQPLRTDYVPPAKMTYQERAAEAIVAERDQDYYRAEQLWLANLSDARQYGAEDHRLGDMLRTLGFFYHYRGVYAKAEAMFLEYIEARTAAYSPDHSNVADAMVELTGVYNFQGKFEKSLPLYEKALAIREKTDGAESQPVATILGWWAGALDNLGREKEASALRARADAIKAKGAWQ